MRHVAFLPCHFLPNDLHCTFKTHLISHVTFVTGICVYRWKGLKKGKRVVDVFHAELSTINIGADGLENTFTWTVCPLGR